MEAALAYRDWLKQDLGAIIDALDLSDLHKHFLRSRWLDTLLWMDNRAKQAQTWHYVLRLTAIIGGVIVPALVSVKMNNTAAPDLIGWLTFVLSLLVALSVAVEGFFHFGDRWKHYRRVSELIKNRRLAIPAAQRALRTVRHAHRRLSPFCRTGRGMHSE